MDNFNPIASLVPTILERLKNEYQAFYFYRSASSWCYIKGYIKASGFFDLEAQDELSHAQQIEQFLIAWGCEFTIPSVSTNQEKFSSFVDLLKKAYEVECVLYSQYDDCARRAFGVDISAFNLFFNFVQIQCWSISHLKNLIDKVNQLGEDSNKKEAIMTFEQDNFSQI